MNFAWSDLLAALALMLVLEGLLPFLNPGGWRRMVTRLAGNSDRELRIGALVCMALGLLLLFFVRS
ncbi:MAG TPA: DUF2065 domain-containing protein [Steroidobacteraceae bacterium]|nr:DUF2065 domain-containing protein [Steroidobacteraceae bacterium]